MTTLERREIMLKHRQRHIESLKKLGYTRDTLHAIKRVETNANVIQTHEANGTLEGNPEDYDRKITNDVKRLFGGTLPKGFFINGDPRGYSLKIDPEAWKVSENAQDNYEAMPIKYTDWGGYMILAPEEF